MRIAFLLLLLIFLGCSKSDDGLSSQRKADIAQLEAQIRYLDGQIANETR